MNDILKNLDWSKLTDILYAVIPALICITLHEVSHGWVAYLLGDRTAKKMGRLSLNPFRHIDIFGLLMMVVFKFGWAKPVPVDMRNFKNPRTGMAITALAGPVSNLILAAVALFLYGVLYRPLYGTSGGNVILELISTTAYLSVALAVFNFIPIPPLDGSKVVFALLPDRDYYKLMRYEKYGMIALMVIFVAGTFSTSFYNMLSRPLYNATSAVFNFLFGIAQFSDGLFH